MTTSFRDTGEFECVPTGKTVTLASICIDRIQGGKIASISPSANWAA